VVVIPPPHIHLVVVAVFLSGAGALPVLHPHFSVPRGLVKTELIDDIHHLPGKKEVNMDTPAVPRLFTPMQNASLTARAWPTLLPNSATSFNRSSRKALCTNTTTEGHTLLNTPAAVVRDDSST
jgi:hypothetical protein